MTVLPKKLFFLELRKKERMIDVKLIEPTNYHDDMVMISRIITWITTTLALEEEKRNLMLRGYIVLNDEDRISVLLICEGEHEQRLLKMLQQPPGEYKDKYVACVLSEEPKVVEEKTDEKSESESDDIAIEIEET